MKKASIVFYVASFVLCLSLYLGTVLSGLQRWDYMIGAIFGSYTIFVVLFWKVQQSRSARKNPPMES